MDMGIGTEVLQIIGIAFLVAVFALVFRELKKEYVPIILVVGGILITLWGITRVFPVITYLRELTDNSEITEYFGVVLRVLGISFIVQIGADICRDLGEDSIASKVEFAGKAAILVVILPVLQSVIRMGFDLLR